MHHIDRVYFEIHALRMDLKAHFFSLDTLKYFWCFYTYFPTLREKSSANVLIDKMRHRNTPFRVFLAHIAQSVERSPLKRMAAGSIPVVGMRRCLFF